MLAKTKRAQREVWWKANNAFDFKGGGERERYVGLDTYIDATSEDRCVADTGSIHPNGPWKPRGMLCVALVHLKYWNKQMQWGRHPFG